MKSVFARLFLKNHVVICEADDWFIDKNGKYTFDNKKLGHAHTYCMNKFDAALKAKRSLVIVSNVNCETKHLKYYLDNAKENGYKVFSIVIENRNNTKSVHNVPDSSILKMEETLRRNLKFTSHE